MTEPDEGIEIRRLQNADNAARRPRPCWKLNFNVLVFALVGLLFIVLLND
jgi:hypothetical protein